LRALSIRTLATEAGEDLMWESAAVLTIVTRRRARNGTREHTKSQNIFNNAVSNIS
jgi:hypothetical protein